MELKDLRQEIDKVDSQLAELFNKRMELCSQVAEYKKQANLPTLDLAREEEVLKQAEERCGMYGREFFQKLMDLSKKQQANIRLK